MRKKYSVTFSLKQPTTTKYIVEEKAGFRHRKIIENVNKPIVYNTEVLAGCELSAIAAAQFEIKRRLGFTVDDLHRNFRGSSGMWFLHELFWDVSTKQIGS